MSPGFDPVLAEVAAGAGTLLSAGRRDGIGSHGRKAAWVPFSEILSRGSRGAGGPLLQSFASPFRDIAFCPTGGVGAGNLADYLALPNVACVGGSWVATAGDMDAGDWSGITAKAKAAGGS